MFLETWVYNNMIYNLNKAETESFVDYDDWVLVPREYLDETQQVSEEDALKRFKDLQQKLERFTESPKRPDGVVEEVHVLTDWSFDYKMVLRNKKPRILSQWEGPEDPVKVREALAVFNNGPPKDLEQDTSWVPLVQEVPIRENYGLNIK